MGRYAIVGFGCAGYNAAKDLLKRLGMTDEPEDTNTNETVNPF